MILQRTKIIYKIKILVTRSDYYNYQNCAQLWDMEANKIWFFFYSFPLPIASTVLLYSTTYFRANTSITLFAYSWSGYSGELFKNAWWLKMFCNVLFSFNCFTKCVWFGIRCCHCSLTPHKLLPTMCSLWILDQHTMTFEMDSKKVYFCRT